MDTIYMNSKHSKISNPHRLLLNLTDKIDLRRKTNILLYHLSIYYTLKNIKKSYRYNKFKILAATWSEEYDIPDGSYSIAYIQDYFEYLLKNMEKRILIFPLEYT